MTIIKEDIEFKGVFLPVLLFVLASGCGAGISGEGGTVNAAAAAQSLYEAKYPSFKVLSQHNIPVSDDFDPIKIALEVGNCYRIIAVGSTGSHPDDVYVSFKHSEQVVETGSDFLELTAEDGDQRKRRVVWGLCAWEALAGDLQIFSNLNASGGHILILTGKAEKLGWKAGRDVRLYLKATGGVDLKEEERKMVEPKLNDILSKDHMNVPPPLQGKAPIFHEIASSNEQTWNMNFTTGPKTCYHLLLASLNCATKYSIIDPQTKKAVYDDGAPPDVGRNGWIQDFCLDSKHKAGENTLTVKFKHLSEEYEFCWFAVAIYGYSATPIEIKKTNMRRQNERKKAAAKAKKCESDKAKCSKKCVKNKGKEKIEDSSCKVKCLADYADCTLQIPFEGEIPFMIAK